MKTKREKCKCGRPIVPKRIDAGYDTCLSCGDKEAKSRRFVVACYNKQGYEYFYNPDDLKHTNPKRTT